MIPFYDEFCAYTTQEDILLYAEELVDNGYVENELDLYTKCLEHFGQEFKKIIKYIVYGED